MDVDDQLTKILRHNLYETLGINFLYNADFVELEFCSLSFLSFASELIFNMASNKEAVAIVLDVGLGMNQSPPGQESDLQTSIAAIQMILQRKLAPQVKFHLANAWRDVHSAGASIRPSTAQVLNEPPVEGTPMPIGKYPKPPRVSARIYTLEPQQLLAGHPKPDPSLKAYTANDFALPLSFHQHQMELWTSLMRVIFDFDFDFDEMFSQSKDEAALVLFGTPETNNDLADGECYENITVARPLGMVDWAMLQYVQNDVQPSNVSGDFLDAMVVAMDHLMKNIQGKRGFASKRLIVFSNMCGEFGDDQLNDIVASMKEAEIELNIIGPDLDEEDDDPKPGTSNGHAKEKSAQQRAGETLLRYMLENVDGESYSFDEALPALSFFQSRAVRSTAWKCQMEIGPDLQIPICLYNRIKEAKPNSFKNTYAKDTDSSIERLRTYHLNDEEETEIEKPDVVDGHRYGSTLVPFSEDDKEAMKYKTQKCFNLLGFTKQENLKRHQLMGDATWVCCAEKGDEPASIAMSALINGMYETNSVAIVRRVYQANSGIKLGVLVPQIKSSYECLFYNEIPFSEDIRQFTFGSLPLKPENTAANQKLAPSRDQIDLMDELVDIMDLTNAEKDEDGESKETLKPKLTFNPHLQRLYQCLQHRALNPDDPLPELSPMVANYLTPPKAVEVKCQNTVEKMKQKYKLEMVAKEKGAETAENIFKDKDTTEPVNKKAKMDDNDLRGGMANLVKAKVTEVGTVTPVDDFKTLIGQTDVDRFEEACKMMKKRVIQLVMDSFGTQLYGKALDCLKALREEVIKAEEPKIFNDFLLDLVDSVKEKGRKDFLKNMESEKLTLISKLECEEGGVSAEEAKNFLKAEDKPQTPPPVEEEEEEDLLAQME